MAQDITGQTLIDLGFAPGPWYRQALAALRAAQQDTSENLNETTIRQIVRPIAPKEFPKVR